MFVADQRERTKTGRSPHLACGPPALGDHPLRYPPLRYPLARERDQFPYEVRVMNYGVGSRPTHRALYTIRPDAVVVLSIRSAAQQDITPDDL